MAVYRDLPSVQLRSVAIVIQQAFTKKELAVPILAARAGYPLLLGHESAYFRLITTSSSRPRISSLDLAPFNPWTTAAPRSPRIHHDLVWLRIATGRSRRILDLVSLRCPLSTIIRAAQVRQLYHRRRLRQLVLHLSAIRDH
jgi:hypothetical protein